MLHDCLVRSSWFVCVFLVCSLVACIDAPYPEQFAPEQQGAAPIAIPGTGGAFLVGTTVTLDGSESFDPDSTSLVFQWTLGSAPAGVTGGALATTPEHTLELTRVGLYALTLEVQDESGLRDSAELFLEALPPALAISAGPNTTAHTGDTVTLAGSITAEDPSPPIISWELVSLPQGSASVMQDASSLTPAFVPDRAGSYTAKLSVEVAGQLVSDTVSIVAQVSHVSLSFRAVDVEYSDTHDRFVVVSETPNLLTLLDARTGDQQTVSLPGTPMAVSIEPGGARAAVGGDGNLTIVDLQTMAVIAAFPVSAIVGDLFFGADDRVHCMPSTGQWTRIRTIDATTGVETLGNGTIRHGTRARLNPGNTAVAYGADNGLSPSDIERYDLSSAPVSLVRDSPYHGDYPMCGNLWFTDDGARIITRCGNTFQSSDNVATDMTYRGRMGQMTIEWADHAAGNGSIAAIQFDYFDDLYTIARFDDQFLNLQSSEAVPQVLEANQFVDARPKWLAHSADETDLFVVAHTDNSTVIFRMSP